uniref:Uncharacterized protein n=1 Tax=Avena sativa TaxID=4498 RepID=A0ACD5VWN5_AVESA
MGDLTVVGGKDVGSCVHGDVERPTSLTLDRASTLQHPRRTEVLPDPIATFDLGDTDKLVENYDECIEKIISIMDEDTDVKYTFIVNEKQVRIPVTPGINDTPDGTYVIRLKKGEVSLYLVATKYMAWFRGIVTNSGGRYEIVDDTLPKILKRSKTLGTSGLYTDLILGEDIARVRLGKHRLEWAFYVLAKLGEEIIRRRRHGTWGDNQLQIGDWFDHSRDFYAEKGGERDVHITISDRTSEAVGRIAKKFRIMCRSMWDMWKSKNESKGSNSSRRP